MKRSLSLSIAIGLALAAVLFGALTVSAGNLSFSPFVQYNAAKATSLYPDAVITADFNKDGKPDLAVANNGGNTLSPGSNGSVTIFPGNGNGSLTRAAGRRPPAAPRKPTGEVIFAENGVEFGRGPVIDGVATFTNELLPVGAHAVTAEYVGDNAFMGSTSTIYQQVVQPLPTAANDAAGTWQDNAVTIAVLANDSDPAGGGLQVASIFLQPVHGTAQVAPDSQTVLYTPAAGFSGQASFVYIAVDANGNTDDATATIVITPKSETDEPAQIAPVNPQVDSSKTFTSPSASLGVQLLAGFYSATLGEKDIFFLSYTPVVTPTEHTTTPPGNLKFGNFAFDLKAFLNEQPQQGIHFALPVTVTITYDPALLAGLKEETLAVYFWNGTVWSTDDINLVARDLTNHTITIAISHLSDFAFFATAPTGENPGPEPVLSQRLYLPAVQK